MRYSFPTINAVGKSIVRHYSITNPWIDFVVIVEPCDVNDAEIAIDAAMDEFWDGDFETYGDAVEHRLRNAGIKYEIVYHDPYDESDEYEVAWEDYLDGLYTQNETPVS